MHSDSADNKTDREGGPAASFVNKPNTEGLVNDD
jgi:hypothetical protein